MHDWQLSEPCGGLCDAAHAAAAGPSRTQQVTRLAAVCGCRRSDAVTTPVAADAPLRHSRFQRVYSNVQYLRFGPAESMVQICTVQFEFKAFKDSAGYPDKSRSATLTTWQVG